MIDDSTTVSAVTDQSTNVSVVLAQARVAGACPKALAWLESLPPDDSVLDHEHAERVEWAVWYARCVIDGRWPAAEAAIATASRAAYLYAYYVIGDRWPEAEAAIAADSKAVATYNAWLASLAGERNG